MRRKLTVLVTGCGARGGVPGLIRGLRESATFDSFVIGADADAYAAGRRLVDQFVLVPQAKHAAYEMEMRRVVDRLKPDVVVPLIDDDIPIVHRLAGELGFRVAATNRESATVIGDKASFLRVARRVGINRERPYVPTRRGDIRRELAYESPAFELPLVAKPRSGSGARRVWLLSDGRPQFADWEGNVFQVATIEDFEAQAGSSLPNYVVSNYVGGSHFSVTCVEVSGAVLAFPIRRRRFTPGITWSGRLEKDRDVLDLTSRLHAAVSLAPVGNVQLVLGSHGSHVYEVNSRFSTTSNVFSGCGLNIVDAVLHRLFGIDYVFDSVPWGSSFARHCEDVTFVSGGFAR